MSETALERIERLSYENTKLREIICQCASALGNGSFVAPNSTIEYMALLPGEIEFAAKRTKTLISALQSPNEGEDK